MGTLLGGAIKQFDCLDTSSPLAGHLFLEASAGTGKTFAIEHIFARLILSRIPIDQILVTTFTKAGVRDLKKRIYQRLYQTTEEHTGENKLLLKNALRQIDEISIYTIHSFCYQMLSMHAFEANSDMRLQDPDELTLDSPLKRVILDTLRTTSDTNEFSPCELALLMRPFRKELSTFVKKMGSFLKQDPRIPQIAPHSLLKEQFKPLQKEELLKTTLSYKKTTNRSKEIHPHFLEQIEAASKGDFDSLVEAEESLFSQFYRGNERVGASTAGEAVLKMAKLIQEARDPKRIFLRMAKKMQERFQKEEVALSPNYLLELMRAKLKNPLFFKAVQKKYQAIIIDEFQDTDPLQWEIFHTLYWETAKLFLVVGDPKQSIYAFRGANLATFLKAKASFDEVYALKTNYRSKPSLIDTLNQMFDEKTTPSLFTFQEGGGQMHYENVLAGVKEESDEKEPRALFLFTENPEEEVFLSFIVSEIERLHTEFGYPYDAFCILIKDRFQGEKVDSYLKKKNLPVLSLGTKNIAEGEIFSLLELLFLLLENPRNDNHLKQFLMHPLIGWPLEKLSFGIEDLDFQSAISSFVFLKTIYETTGLPALIEAFSKTPFPTHPFLETIVTNKEAYADFVQLTSLLLSTPEESILSLFKELKLLDPEENPKLKRIPLLEEKAVKVMTSHMSKGLEFPIVFSLGTGKGHSLKHEFIKKQTGEHAVFKEDDPECKEALLLQDLEKLRLFYVACTRAKERLYLFASFAKLKLSPSPIELFLGRMGKPFMTYQETCLALETLSLEEVKKTCDRLEFPYKVLFEESAEIISSKTTIVDILPPTLLEIKKEESRSLSFSSLTKDHETKRLTVTPLPEDLPPGSETGHLFHILLEKIIEEGLYYNWEEKRIRSLLEKEVAFSPLKGKEDRVYELLFTAFHTPLENFILKDIPPSQMLQEMRFLYPKEGHLMNGFIDLVFVHQGTYYILDWKLNLLPSYTPETIQAAMEQNKYTLQAKIYQEALELHLKGEPFGGIFYFFLRGKENGLIHLSPEKALV